MNCIYCDKTFTRKFTLKRHIMNKDCPLNTDKLWELQESSFNKSSNSGNVINGNVNNLINGNVNINVIIQANPISKLNVDYILPEKMKNLVEKYDYDKSNLLLSEYIKDIIHNKEHPENHSVKYIKKKPPTFSNTIENEEGETINVIKNLKDSCELLSEPVLANLKQKLRQCKKVFKNDTDFLNVYGDTVKEIYKELNKDLVKKSLSTVLQTDILNDIEMKLNKTNF
jgi:hypothetical protein